ncbi:MAG: PTS sugar transporter subunit IIA [Micropruina sp.]|uniref:PTS sugar transporter subunit IIA n=1 Tax=Micropruina sp. TaxID=2737536 RepID=UPI0039E6579C
MNVILVGHGKTGPAMKDAVEMIFGAMPRFYPVEFLPGDGYESLTATLEATIKDNELAAEATVVVADLFSGSPYNAAATLAIKGGVSDVIAGMSLPICLTLAQYADDGDPRRAVGEIAAQASTFTRILSDELKKSEDEEDF